MRLGSDCCRRSDQATGDASAPPVLCPLLAAGTGRRKVVSLHDLRLVCYPGPRYSAITEGGMENTAMVIVVVLAFGIYFLPTCIAGFRNHHQQYAILALNLFLGWTFVGWVIALAWALTAKQPGSNSSG